MNKPKFFNSFSQVGMVEAVNKWEAAVKFGKIRAHMSSRKLTSIAQSKTGIYKVQYSDGSVGKLEISEVV